MILEPNYKNYNIFGNFIQGDIVSFISLKKKKKNIVI